MSDRPLNHNIAAEELNDTLPDHDIPIGEEVRLRGEKPHQGCSCSRSRKCAFHAGQIKQMQKVAKPVIEARKVEVGIEDLRAKYAKPVKRDYPLPPRAQRRNGWTPKAAPVQQPRQRGKNAT